MIKIEDVMTKNPITLSKFDSVFDARQLMESKGFRHIPIVGDKNELLGLITQRDILSHGNSSQKLLNKEELKQIESGVLLADVMSKGLTTISPACSVKDAAEILFKHKYGCLPVIDKNNQLEGIITDHDFVAITVHLLELMQQQEPLEFDE